MVYVKIISSDAELNFEGNWRERFDPQSILDEFTEKAKMKGIPVMITIERFGTYSISPHGQVLHGHLYDVEKLKEAQRGKRKRRK